MNNPPPARPQPARTQKRSGCVRLLLVGTVVGICGFAVYSCVKDDEVDDNEVEYVRSGSSYTNNHYVPGVGYYHAPFHGWFSNRYNDHDPARGHFYNGGWHSSPHTSNITNSTPDTAAVSRVNSSWRAANPGDVASRKASIAKSRSVFRGGFGSSGRSSS